LKKIIIAGFGSAGYAASIAVKKNMPAAEITVIDNKESDLMHPCALPYSLEGVVKEENILQNINLPGMKIKKIKAVAVKADTLSKKLYVKSDETDSVEYDSLILTTGSKPLIPPIKGIIDQINKKIFTLSNINDLKHITAAIKGSSNAVIIGGGAIGLESAFALNKAGLSVSVAEAMPQILPGILDEDMAQAAEEYIKSSGIEVLTSSMISEIKENKGLELSIDKAEILKSDFAILAAGFKPDTSIAELSGLKINPNGIVTDKKLMTSAQDVYAAGDCVSGWSIISGKESRAKLATSAYKQGTAAGINASGGNFEYRGTAGTFVTIIGELEIAGTGFNSEIAKQHGYDPVSGKIKTNILPEYFPTNSQIQIKIIFDKSSGKILGAQAVGKKGCAERMNIISMAIEFGISIEDIGRLEMAYCPAISEVNDPLLRAVDFGLRRIKK
jgi:NADH oxidase (H2O2-forming)